MNKFCTLLYHTIEHLTNTNNIEFVGNWMDPDEKNEFKGIKPHLRYNFNFGSIYSGKLLPKALNFDITGKKSLRIIVSAHTRAGRNIRQQSRSRRYTQR